MLPEDDLVYEKGEQDDILSLSTWAKYMNPIEVFIRFWKEWYRAILIEKSYNISLRERNQIFDPQISHPIIYLTNRGKYFNF